MTFIPDPPPAHPGDFGHEFNYNVWSPGTDVTLCNVRWNSDYRDIVNFENQAALDTYLIENSGPTIRITGMTYARPGQPVRINIPFNDAYRFNYLRVRNAAQPVGESAPRTFYYFIRDVRHIAPNTTELEIQLDVWQTFGRGVTFGHCYVERSHLGIANENNFADNGREYLTVPEGFDLGGEYEITQHWRQTIGTIDTFDIIVTSTVEIGESGGTVDDPVLKTAKGSEFEGLPNGAAMYYFTSRKEFVEFMEDIHDKPWISQGIISIQAVPNLNLRPKTVDADGNVLFGDYVTQTSFSGHTVKRLINSRIDPVYVPLKDDWRDDVLAKLPARYRHLKKFLTYPYTVVELTTYSGNPLLLKPESMYSAHLGVMQLMHVAPPSPRIVFYPYRYNSGGLPHMTVGDNVVENDQAEFLDMTTGIMNLPTFATVNNAYTSFLASNANTLPYQYQAADWAQQRALQGNQVAFDQASQNIGLTRQMTDLGVNASTARTDLANTTGGYRALQGAAGSLIGGAAMGPAGLASGAMGAVNQGLGYAIDVNQRNNELAINSGLARSQTRAQTANAGYMRDTNKDFADFAATGDYEMSIAALNAKVQDARMIQPTTSGQMGGDAFNLVQYRWAIHAKVKTLQGAAMNAIGDFWNRYGYAMNRFIFLARLDVMTRFTYWKLKETYITSSTCPEAFRQTIRGIFEKGVTVWNNPADIGRISIDDNKPLTGITL